MTLPLPGPEKADCPCGCGLFGTVRKKTWSDGSRHVRSCKCRRCEGGRQKPRATVRETKFARETGGERSPLSGALSGYDVRVPLLGGGWVYVEETTQEAFCRGLERWWGNAGTQLKLSRLLHLQDGLRCVVTPGLSVMPTVDMKSLLAVASGKSL